MIAWIFPGQGSQSVGMGAGLDAGPALGTFGEAREILGWDVRSVCLHGPEEDLASTEVAQPALLTVSVAAARALRAAGCAPDAVAGHSVGEFAALVDAGALSFEDALRTISVRADAMGRAGRVIPGRMAAVLGARLETVEAACLADPGVVVVANVNEPGQIVISGEADAVDRVGARLREQGARRIIPLAVSVAAHSPLVIEAATLLRRALAAVEVREPAVPFVSCSTARVVERPDTIRDLLVDGVTGRVQWSETALTLARMGADRFVEVGPGRVLSGLIRRIMPDAPTVAVADVETARTLARDLVAEGAP